MKYQGTKLPKFEPRKEAVSELEVIDIEIGTAKWKHYNIKGGNILEAFNITTQTRNYEVSVRILYSGGNGSKFTLQLLSNNLPYNILAEVPNLSSITNIIIGIRPVINHKKEDFVPAGSNTTNIKNVLFHLTYALQN